MTKTYAAVLSLGLVLTGAACDRGEPGELRGGAEAVTVRVSHPETVEGRVQVPARIVARETADLATRVSGTIEAIPVDVGDRVISGQVLVRLEASGVASSIARAQAQVTVARRTFDRMSNLERDGAATRQELDQAEASLRSAEAALEEALAAREYVTMRAPFDGTITARHADPGNLAVPGQPVLTVTGARGVKIAADLPADLAATIAPDDPVRVVRSDTGERWSARVTRVVPVIELRSQRFRVEAAFDSDVEPPAAGTFARIEFGTTGEANQWIPADAVVRRGQLSGVFVVIEDELRLRWIRPGRSSAGALEVLAGLPVGEPVVRRPGPLAFDGMTVAGVGEEAWSFSEEAGR